LLEFFADLVFCPEFADFFFEFERCIIRWQTVWVSCVWGSQSNYREAKYVKRLYKINNNKKAQANMHTTAL
jgi:hypothetical protein